MQKTLCKKEFTNCEIVKENKELQQRIDTAIEYIIEEYFKRKQLGITDKTFQEWEIQELLKILEGK